MEHRGYKVIFNIFISKGYLQEICIFVFHYWNGPRRRGIKKILNIFYQNEMAYLEFIHNLVETLDKYFENVVIILF